MQLKKKTSVFDKGKQYEWFLGNKLNERLYTGCLIARKRN